MTLDDLGYNKTLKANRIKENLDAFEVGRVILEHKERYVVKTSEYEYEAELIGNLRFKSESRHDFPAVGDWVAFSEYDDGKALIHAIYPRKSIIERQAVGKTGHIQLIAANVDYGLIVQSVDRDFNLNRLERYLTICYASKVDPIIVLSKIDLINENDLKSIINQINNRLKDVLVLTVSNQTIGYSEVISILSKGKTYCLLGSSGVGKSTLLNSLSGEELMKTGEISSSVNKGKHITTHRELIVLNSGGILIDNPGMREVGITDTSEGFETTFETILDYSKHCRFKDCTHTHEMNCAVLEALENGGINENSYLNFLKMEKEKSHFETDVLERKKRDKEFGKMVKHVKKLRKNNKY